MDSEEVDIGTVRNLEASSWIPPYLQTDTPLSSKPLLRGLTSPSAPDIVEDVLSHRAQTTAALTRQKTLPNLRRTSGAASDPDLPTLDVEKVATVRRWIMCVAENTGYDIVSELYTDVLATVDFDLDIGPVLSCLYPPLKLSSECRENIAFSSFPDSSIFETGSQIHSFTLAGLESEEIVTSTAYGYASFMQRRDSTSKRGYLQRSVVILSHHPFPSLFEELVSILAPLNLSHGSLTLETACQNISSWPDPSPGSTLQLGFLGHALQAHLPQTEDELQFHEASETFNPRSHILASVPPTNPPPLVVFSACLSSLWSIWELVILCEPILIFGPSPRIASLAVVWLRDLVRPIPLAGDFRPYITIHDRDYTSLINKYPPKAGLVIGVTNPFILSVTKHWPNVLSLAWEDKHTLLPNGKGKPSRDMPGSGPVPGFLSQTHKRFTSKDRPLLKSWETALEKGGHLEHTASQGLRRHFSSRTASFLVPLNRYLNSLIPSPAEASMNSDAPSRSKLRLKPFNTAHFLTSLKTHGTPLPFRSSTKQREFYEKWLRTPAFALWLAGQEQVVTGVLEDSGPRSVS